MLKVGFVGLGAMGAPMAGHLHRAGLLTAVSNRSAGKAQAFAAAHAGVAVSQAVGLRVHIGSGYRVKAEVAAALGHAQRAEDDFKRAIEILAAVKHEVELARAYQGLAAIKERSGQLPEAQKLRGRATDIFTRLRGAAQTD